MGSQKRVEPGTDNKIILKNPGPTAYEIPSKVIQTEQYQQIVEGPRFSLSPKLEKEKNKFKRVVPGPGQYTPSTLKQGNFSFSFGLKTNNNGVIKYIASVPGPGQYETHERQAFSRIGASLDKSKQIEFLNKTQRIVPGPGTYESLTHSLISRNTSPKYGFGFSHKRSATSQDVKKLRSSIESAKCGTPGPGQYELRSIIGNEGQKKSLSSRFYIDLESRENRFKPGPGEYAPEIQQLIRQSPKYKIGTSTRDNYYLKDKQKTQFPPPNSYNPKIEGVKRSSPATAFGYGDRSFLNKTLTCPGPGNYETLTQLGEGPKYGMGLKIQNTIEQKRALELPSPDCYNPKFQSTIKKDGIFSVGKAQRISLERKDLNPGPGQYFSPDLISSFRESPKFGFGSSLQRPQHKNGIEVPGPGQYRINTQIADVPKYIIPNQAEEFKYV